MEILVLTCGPYPENCAMFGTKACVKQGNSLDHPCRMHTWSSRNQAQTRVSANHEFTWFAALALLSFWTSSLVVCMACTTHVYLVWVSEPNSEICWRSLSRCRVAFSANKDRRQEEYGCSSVETGSAHQFSWFWREVIKKFAKNREKLCLASFTVRLHIALWPSVCEQGKEISRPNHIPAQERMYLPRRSGPTSK